MKNLIVEINDISRSGSGVGKLPDGRIVFIPRTCRGDTVRIEIIKEKKNYCEAKVIDFLQKSMDRIEPKCLYYMQCGGCQLQHLPYEAQWSLKKEGVLSVLKKNNLLSNDLFNNLKFIEDFPAKNIWNYRNRIQLKGQGHRLGFYQKATHQIIDVDHCEIAHEALNDELKEIKKTSSRSFGDQEFKVELELTSDKKVAISYNQSHAALGFRQVNDEQNQKLINWIRSQIQGNEILVDFYGGNGNLSLPLVDQFQKIYCIDSVQNRKIHLKLENFEFINSDSVKWAQKNKRLFFDKKVSILVDPPRDGLGKSIHSFLEGIKNWNVKELILVGCEVDPWVRDLKIFHEHSFRIEKFAFFDFFPQTRHIESAAYLSRLL